MSTELMSVSSATEQAEYLAPSLNEQMKWGEPLCTCSALCTLSVSPPLAHSSMTFPGSAQMFLPLSPA